MLARLGPSGLTGSGVDVALIDSGVTPVAGLDDAGKVVNGPDLSFESQNSGTRYLDTFGHGTFMAGIIAGYDGTLSNGSLSDTYNGVAPNARVISLKVADAHGNTDVSQVIAAIDWVVQHRKDPGMNIRVLNLSFGTPSMQSYLLDPLAYAAEVAWRKGIVVVVSAGNDGTGTGKLLNPAQDPYVLAVGAEDSGGTPSIGDDTIPSFSTRGDGVRNPDVVAPGKSLQGLRVPGSYIDTQYGGTAAFEGRYFRGSGTSQAAAVVSGAAAAAAPAAPVADAGPGQGAAHQHRDHAAGGRRAGPGQRLGEREHGDLDPDPGDQAAVPGLDRDGQPRRCSRSSQAGAGRSHALRGEGHLRQGVQQHAARHAGGDGDELERWHVERLLVGRVLVGRARRGPGPRGRAPRGPGRRGRARPGPPVSGTARRGRAPRGPGSSWAGSSWAGSSWAGSSWATGTWG